jgi:hypothetical protein
VINSHQVVEYLRKCRNAIFSPESNELFATFEFDLGEKRRRGYCDFQHSPDLKLSFQVCIATDQEFEAIASMLGGQERLPAQMTLRTNRIWIHRSPTLVNPLHKPTADAFFLSCGLLAHRIEQTLLELHAPGPDLPGGHDPRFVRGTHVPLN